MTAKKILSFICMTLLVVPVATAQTGSLSGTVVADGMAVEGVSVCIDGMQKTEITGRSGTFRFDNLEPGTYGLTAMKTGYESGTADNVSVSAGEETGGVEIEIVPLVATGTLSVTAVDAMTGTAIRGASVMVEDTNFSAETDTQGRASIENVPAGQYTVLVSHRGYHSREVIGEIGPQGGYAECLDVELEPEITTGTVSGTVVDDDRAPLDQVSISIEGTSKTAYTDITGHYTITDVPAGRYTVTAEKSGYRSDSRPSVEVHPGEMTNGVDFSLSPLMEQGNSGRKNDAGMGG